MVNVVLRVCVWQLDRVPGQLRWVRVQTGGQSSGRNNEWRAFENPEAERTGEHRLSRLNWLKPTCVTAEWNCSGYNRISWLSCFLFFFFACPAGGEGNKYTRGQEWDGGEFVQICSQWSTASVPPESHYMVRVETDIKFLTRNISVCYVTWNRSCSPSSVLDVMFGWSSRCAVVRCTACVIALHLMWGSFISFCRYGWPLQTATASTSCENKARGLPLAVIHPRTERTFPLRRQRCCSFNAHRWRIWRGPVFSFGARWLCSWIVPQSSRGNQSTGPSIMHTAALCAGSVCCSWQRSSLLSSPARVLQLFIRADFIGAKTQRD